ncbi:MAG: nucleotide exchange factor GrpE [Synergistaceae bacterium]|nr:nucleotide exchange factor GrpE [Synergistaceae bacterium]
MGPIDKRIFKKIVEFLRKVKVFISNRLVSTDKRISKKITEFAKKNEAYISNRLVLMDKRTSGKIEEFGKKIEANFSNRLVSADKRAFEKVEELGERIEAYISDHLVSMDERISEKIEELEGGIEAYISDRLNVVDERIQQSVRQERRNQAALESVFENQKSALLILRRMRDESKSLKPLMAFTESFVLWHRSQPDSPEFQVLWAKLAAILDQFGLEILAETGVPFNPSIHEACAVRCDPCEPEGYVLELVRPGFSSGGEVLRYASVVVNRPAVVTNDETSNWIENEEAVNRYPVTAYDEVVIDQRRVIADNEAGSETADGHCPVAEDNETESRTEGESEGVMADEAAVDRPDVVTNDETGNWMECESEDGTGYEAVVNPYSAAAGGETEIGMESEAVVDQYSAAADNETRNWTEGEFEERVGSE